MAIPSYNNNYQLYTTATDNGVKQNTTRGKGPDQMGMMDFLNLLVAQMQNQDMMDPQSNTEFVSQLAQFSSLQAMNTIGEYALSSYAVSYVGKNVLIAHQNPSTGQIEEIAGKVDKITFYMGSPMVIVDGVEYPLHTVMQIAEEPIEIKKPSESGEDNDEDETGTDNEVNTQ